MLDRNKLTLLLLIIRRRQQKLQNVTVNQEHYLNMIQYSDYQFKSVFRAPKRVNESLVRRIASLNPSFINIERNLLICLYRLAHGTGYRATAAFFQISHSCARTGFWHILKIICKNSFLFIKYPLPEAMSLIAEDFARKTPRKDIHINKNK